MVQNIEWIAIKSNYGSLNKGGWLQFFKTIANRLRLNCQIVGETVSDTIITSEQVGEFKTNVLWSSSSATR